MSVGLCGKESSSSFWKVGPCHQRLLVSSVSQSSSSGLSEVSTYLYCVAEDSSHMAETRSATNV